MAKFQIFLVDDHPYVREGYAALLNSTDDLEVCGEAERVVDALPGIARTMPDLVVVDISLPGPSGLELVALLHAERPLLPLLVVTGHEEPSFARRARAAGAAGFLLKHQAFDRLIVAIRQLLSEQAPQSQRRPAARA